MRMNDIPASFLEIHAVLQNRHVIYMFICSMELFFFMFLVLSEHFGIVFDGNEIKIRKSM